METNMNGFAAPNAPKFAENQLAPEKSEPCNSPQLTDTVMYDSAPWMYSALMQIHDKEQSGDVLAGVGDFTVNPHIADVARTAVLNVSLSELPAPTVTH